ncbi:hypothetical protein FIBSPDRAFT_858917 [Athelia psychrophila]|uniref:Uncharacterized protein n=1 Tax=Athelia psychrophila TaxID=1759441 RepID=A0A166LIA8_9AGAM|nr:hypothetical protein FIBSPDRAFT_879613 [Fibularhizoctonia sp. CBS 109695]KZP22986.1 hypothetical protein FIBSPDRAFT_858917 [Fibularhizoctonia sp. CBS 109695]
MLRAPIAASTSTGPDAVVSIVETIASHAIDATSPLSSRSVCTRAAHCRSLARARNTCVVPPRPATPAWAINCNARRLPAFAPQALWHVIVHLTSPPARARCSARTPQGKDPRARG